MHRGGVMLQDALCCSSGLFQQVLTASAGCFTVPLYVLVFQWMGGMKAGKEVESIDRSVFVLFLSQIVLSLLCVKGPV